MIELMPPQKKEKQMPETNITEDMISRASAVLWNEARPPAVVDIRDFTDEEIMEGKLTAAYKGCTAENRDLVRRALKAAMNQK